MKYVSFLRGVNVGGKALIKMTDLKQSLSQAGFLNVTTYIQSGNIIFESYESDKQKLANHLKNTIDADYNLSIAVALFTDQEWKSVINQAPEWWGKDPKWEHSLLILVADTTTEKVIEAIGALKPDIELVEAGNRVIYQSMSFIEFGKTTTGKLASNPAYKQLTIRNYNTATKLASLLA